MLGCISSKHFIFVVQIKKIAIKAFLLSSDALIFHTLNDQNNIFVVKIAYFTLKSG